MNLAARDVALEELMDDPACDPDRLRATLQRFALVNRLVSGWGAVYRARLGPHLARLGRPARVLDLGSGGGDVIVRLAQRAARDGLDVTWIGADPDPRAHAVAVARDAPATVSFRCVDAETLLAEGGVFDAVISNHVLHHLGADAGAFLERTRTLSRGPVLHADIARGRTAYALYTVGITPFAPGTFLRTDGLRSIRRSFTREELRRELDEVSPGAWTVEAPVAFRLLAVAAGTAAARVEGTAAARVADTGAAREDGTAVAREEGTGATAEVGTGRGREAGTPPDATPANAMCPAPGTADTSPDTTERARHA